MVPGATVGSIAMLRLDGDWYASTKVCLDHLYEFVAPGGFIVIDDYHAYDGCALAVDQFRANHKIEAPIMPIDVDAVFWRR